MRSSTICTPGISESSASTYVRPDAVCRGEFLAEGSEEVFPASVQEKVVAARSETAGEHRADAG